MEAILELQEVDLDYHLDGEVVAVLEKVQLQIGRGEFVCLMGQSGSGKSSILNVLAGLLSPTRGVVRLQGQNLYQLSDHERTLMRRESIGFVFQFFNLIPSLTVEDNVALPLLIAGEDPAAHRTRLQELLELVGLPHRPRHFPRQLSGGEMQRVTIARAMVTQPQVLLADEPTGNVSAKMGVEIMEILQRAHRERQQTILLVTHNHKDARRGDRVVFLNNGRIDPKQVAGDEVSEARILSVLQELDI
jgi:putative ABC transport system ATP-binding protein